MTVKGVEPGAPSLRTDNNHGDNVSWKGKKHEADETADGTHVADVPRRHARFGLSRKRRTSLREWGEDGQYQASEMERT